MSFNTCIHCVLTVTEDPEYSDLAEVIQRVASVTNVIIHFTDTGCLQFIHENVPFAYMILFINFLTKNRNSHQNARMLVINT